MTKRLFTLLFLSILLLTACDSTIDPEVEEVSAKVDVEDVEEVAEDVDGYVDYSIQGMEYAVLRSWTVGATEDHLKYYYPEDGMLMIEYIELEESIANRIVRDNFIDGFTAALDSSEVFSESKIAVGGHPAYEYTLTMSLDEEDIESSLVIFEYHEGIIALIMSTSSQSDQDHHDEFQNVLNSIEFPDRTVEAAVEESAGNGIVLGKPFELGEYTLTFQQYSLGKDYEGNDALIIDYDWVNNSEETTAPFMTFTVKGFQDGVETDHRFMVDGVDLGIGQKDVRPDGVIEGAQEIVGISDLTKPLELEIDELFSFTRNPYITVIDLSTLE